MATKPTNAKLTQTIQLLLADDIITQQRGQDELNDERRNLIAQLSTIASDPDNHVRKHAAVARAMGILGEWRATEAVKVLVTFIGFPHVKHPGAGEYPAPPVEGGDFAKTVEQLYPAVPALIQIGDPCVDEVVNKLATTDNLIEIRACEAVLMKLAKAPSVRKKLEVVVERNKSTKRAKQLEAALKKLDEGAAATQK